MTNHSRDFLVAIIVLTIILSLSGCGGGGGGVSAPSNVTGSISGKISNASIGPVYNALIQSEGLSTNVDSRGAFRLTGLPLNKSITISITANGFYGESIIRTLTSDVAVDLGNIELDSDMKDTLEELFDSKNTDEGPTAIETIYEHAGFSPPPTTSAERSLFTPPSSMLLNGKSRSANEQQFPSNVFIDEQISRIVFNLYKDNRVITIADVANELANQGILYNGEAITPNDLTLIIKTAVDCAYKYGIEDPMNFMGVLLASDDSIPDNPPDITQQSLLNAVQTSALLSVITWNLSIKNSTQASRIANGDASQIAIDVDTLWEFVKECKESAFKSTDCQLGLVGGASMLLLGMIATRNPEFLLSMVAAGVELPSIGGAFGEWLYDQLSPPVCVANQQQCANGVLNVCNNQGTDMTTTICPSHACNGISECAPVSNPSCTVTCCSDSGCTGQTSHCINPGTSYSQCVACTQPADCGGDSTAWACVNNTCIANEIPNQPPTATISAIPTWGYPPLTVSFSGGCMDSDGACVSYNWNFGDGSPSNSLSNPTHIFDDVGSYLVTLTVMDNGGSTNTQSKTISVFQTVCGNGVVESGELCDDGNTNSPGLSDSCGSNCRYIEYYTTNFSQKDCESTFEANNQPAGQGQGIAKASSGIVATTMLLSHYPVAGNDYKWLTANSIFQQYKDYAPVTTVSDFTITGVNGQKLCNWLNNSSLSVTCSYQSGVNINYLRNEIKNGPIVLFLEPFYSVSGVRLQNNVNHYITLSG